MRIGEQRAGRQRLRVSSVDRAVSVDVAQRTLGIQFSTYADDVALPRTDAVGVSLDLGQPSGRHHGAEEAAVSGERPVVGAVVDLVHECPGRQVQPIRVDQLHHPDR